jgi:hypothetical protein
MIKSILGVVWAFLFCSVLVLPFSVHAQDVQLTDCDKYPGSVGCAVIEAPGAAVIPSETREISLDDGPTFSGGGCPADVVVSVAGMSITALPMASACAWISAWVRPLFLLIAGITAVFILLPDEGD